MKTFNQFVSVINEKRAGYVTGDETHKGYHPSHGGKNYHDHLEFDDPETTKAAMDWMKKQGWEIGSTTGGKHAKGSRHYLDRAFDIPMYRPSGSGVQKGFTDDKVGERAMSASIRNDLARGGFGISSLYGGGYTPPKVLSKLKGVEGTGAGKDFVARQWSDTEKSRYKAFGGK